MPHRAPLTEWTTTSMMIGIALCILLTPMTIEMGSFRYLRDFGFTAGVAVFTFAAVGLLRIFALYANGRWPGGWKARLAGSVAGAMVWAYMAYALLLLTRETGTLSIGIPVYACLSVAEVISCYRIGLDSSYRAHRARHAADRFGGRTQQVP